MASVRKRGKAETYEVRWHIGNGQYGSEGGFANKRDALRYGQEQEAIALFLQIRQRPSMMTV